MLKIANDLLYNHPLKENHRFPMIKYELIPEQLLMKTPVMKTIFLIQAMLKMMLYSDTWI